MQILPLQRMLVWVLVGLVSFGPLLVGVFPIVPAAVIPVLLLVFSLYAFSSRSASPRAKQIAVALLSISFALTLAELVARPVMSRLRDDRPEAISPHSLARLPQIYRYLKNVSYRDSYYGDLAIMAGKKEWREPRDLRFVTDRFGFRNEPTESNNQAREIDLIMLGDSVGEGLGTSQESTWSSIFERSYGLKTYNLSVDGAGPWQELINLSLEIDRLRTNEKAIVLWAITGNDLNDDYYPQLQKEQLPWLSALGSLLHSFKTFRDNSQLRRILQVSLQAGLPSDKVIARDFIDGRPLFFYRNNIESCNLKFDNVVHHPNYQMLSATMKAMRELAEAKRLTVAVVLIPCKEEVYSWVLDGKLPWTTGGEPSGFSLALKALSEQNHFPFLDLKPSFIHASQQTFEESRGVLYWRDDTHWNVQGHKIAASIVYQDLLLPMKTGNPNSLR